MSTEQSNSDFTESFLIGLRRAILALLTFARPCDIDAALIELGGEGERGHDAARIIRLARHEVER